MSSSISQISGAHARSRAFISLEIWHRDDAAEVVSISYVVGHLDLAESSQLYFFLEREVVPRTKRNS